MHVRGFFLPPGRAVGLKKVETISVQNDGMVPESTISYALDVAPHLRKLFELRARREERRRELHDHRDRAIFWRLAIPSCIAIWVLAVYGLYWAFLEP